MRPSADPRQPGHLLPQGLHPADRCCVATAAATAPSPSPRPGWPSPVPLARRGPGHRPGRRRRRLPRGPLHPGRGARGPLPGGPALARRPRLRLDRRLPGGRLPRSSATRPASSPTPTPAPSGPTTSAGCRAVSASQGMMLESLDPDLDCHRGAPDKTPERRLATLEAAGTPRHPLHHRPPRRHRRDPRRTVSRPSVPSPTPTGRHGHVQEVIVQNFLPKPGTAMHNAPALPARRAAWTIAVARLVLPPDVHVQAPPNLSDDLAPLLDSGIDDWGGVSPVTVDHVNPERAWPALDILRAATEAAGHGPRPPPHRLSRVRPRSASAGSTRHALPGARPLRRRGPGPRRRLVLGRDGRPAGPARSRDRSRESVRSVRSVRSCRSFRYASNRCRRRGGRGARRRQPRPGAWARTRSSPSSGPGAPRSGPWPRWPTSSGADDGGRRRHLGGQPQHQLHQRLHLQVPVLRLLQGPALAQPPGRALPPRAERHHRPGRRGRGAPAPPRSASRAASTPTSTATTTSR